MRQNETCPSYSPWGGIQHRKQIAPGVWNVETAGHGGIYVAPSVLATIPDCLKENTFAGPGWFEEDCDWALVVVALPHLFTPYERFSAVRSVMEWNKEKWSQYGNTEAGKALLAEVMKYEADNAERFTMGSMSTGGKGWSVCATSLDCKTRIRFECADYPTLPGPFTIAEAQAVALPGTFESGPARTKAPETLAEILP